MTLSPFRPKELFGGAGMARDSRSLRSGLSNAELLAKDMNALQASVETHIGPDGRAMFWDGKTELSHSLNRSTPCLCG